MFGCLADKKSLSSLAYKAKQYVCLHHLECLLTPFGMFVYTIWNVCLHHLECLFTTFGMFVYSIWNVCLHHLKCLFTPFGMFVYTI